MSSIHYKEECLNSTKKILLKGKFGITACVLILTLSLIGGHSLFAESGSLFEDCVSFADALDLNLSLDPTIGEAESDQVIAAAKLKQIKSDWKPQLSSYARTATGQTGLVDGRTDNQVGLILSQRLFDFGRGRVQKEAAQARVNAANLTLGHVTSSSSLDVAQTYLSVLQSLESLAAAKMREENMIAIEEGVARRLQTNLITAAEARSIEADKANAVSNRIEIGLGLAEDKSRLSILLGTNKMACSNVGAVDGFLQDRLPLSLDQAVLITSNNPELRSAKALAVAAKAEYQSARLSQMPILEVQGVAAKIHDDDLNRWNTSHRVGLEVSTPLYGGRYSGQRAEARANSRSAVLRIERLEREVKESTSLTWQRIKAYDDLAVSRDKARESLKLEAQALRKEFNNGLRTYQEIETIEADLQLSVLQAIEARYLARQQRIKLLALSNRLSNIVANNLKPNLDQE